MEYFTKISKVVGAATGSPFAFIFAAGLIVICLLYGPPWARATLGNS